MEARRVMACGIAGVVGVAAFASALVLLQMSRPEIDWKRHYVSEFANGPAGWLFIMGAAVHGLGNLALAAGLRRSLGPAMQSRAAVFLLALAAAGILTAAFFPTDAGGQARTVAGLVHRLVASACFPLELVALFLFSATFAANPLWRRFSRPTFVWGLVMVLTLALLVLAVLWNRMPGLAERVALAGFMVWELGAALGLIHAAPGQAFRRSEQADAATSQGVSGPARSCPASAGRGETR